MYKICKYSEFVEGAVLLMVAFLLVNAPNCHLSLVLASAVQGDAANCNTMVFKLCAVRVS